MNREQAQSEYLDLLNKKIDDEKKIIENAKRNGIWKDGLDSNRDLFTELDREFARKVEKLKDKCQEGGA